MTGSVTSELLSLEKIKMRNAFSLHQQGQLGVAKSLYEEIITTNPNHYDALHMLGVLCYSQKNAIRAEELIRRAIKLKNGQAEFHCNYGLVVQSLGKVGDALRSYDQALRLKPDYPEAHINRGQLLLQMGRFSEALQNLDQAIRLRPSAPAYTNRGLALKSLRRFTEAIQSFQAAIALDQNFVDAYINLGAGHAYFGEKNKALTCFDKAVALNPNSAAALSNRAAILRDLGRFKEAVQSISRAEKLDPTSREICANHGAILADIERYDEALSRYEKALEISPTHIACNWGKALALLGKGDFLKAWPYYEYRIDNPKLGIKPPKTSTPRWTGESVGDIVLILQEQGIGDAIFFSRLLDQAARHCRKLIVRVDSRLVATFCRSFPAVEVISDETPVDQIFHVKSALIGSLFNILSLVGDSEISYVYEKYIVSNIDHTKKIRSSLGINKNLICGVSWKSFRPDGGVEKSLSLEQLLPLLSNKNVTYVSLQYGDVDDEIDQFNANHDIKIERYRDIDNRNDIDGHTALVDSCDFVISVSNSSAHVAGALGKPGAILLSRGIGRLFYWNNRTGSRSFWYPSLSLFDQDWEGQWGAAIDGAQAAFKMFLMSREISG